MILQMTTLYWENVVMYLGTLHSEVSLIRLNKPSFIFTEVDGRCTERRIQAEAVEKHLHPGGEATHNATAPLPSLVLCTSALGLTDKSNF